MKRTEKDFQIGDWIRECQECGNIQKDNLPNQQKELSTSYEMRKCRHCKSEALDYGREITPPYEVEEEE